jgi:hypothetical protein
LFHGFGRITVEEFSGYGKIGVEMISKKNGAETIMRCEREVRVLRAQNIAEEATLFGGVSAIRNGIF